MKKILLIFVLASSSFSSNIVNEILQSAKKEDTDKIIKLSNKLCNDENHSENYVGCEILSIIYENGFGVKKDIKKSIKYYKKAVQLKQAQILERQRKIELLRIRNEIARGLLNGNLDPFRAVERSLQIIEIDNKYNK